MFASCREIVSGGSSSQAVSGQKLANTKNGDSNTFNGEKREPSTWPSSAKGVGLSEAPRGALAHWIVIENDKIANYQLVVPPTWNASPRDASARRSAQESSFIGVPLAMQPACEASFAYSRMALRSC